MSERTPPRTIPFTSLKGRALSALLQLEFVRFHRVQLGFVEHPTQYASFLADVVGPRIAALQGRVGIFGAGEHTRVLLESTPALDSRVCCLIDNNKALWKQERFGHTILPPAEAIKECQVIVLSTAVFQQQLLANLKTLGYTGAIVAMDDVVPPSWFLAA